MEFLSKKWSFKIILMVIAVGVAFIPSVNAEVYKWKDANGRTHFSDHPPAGSSSEKVSITPPSVIPSAAVEESASAVSEEKKVTQPRVVMYATSWCPYCAQARKYFRENGIPFTEYDLEKSSRYMREFKKLGGTGYPLILIGKNERMHGFSIEGFERRYYKGR